MNPILKKLQEGEKMALQLRKDYKELLWQQPKYEWKNKILFPAMHIQEDDTILRYGMPWIYNGFGIVTSQYGLLVDPGVDFPYRWIKSWYQVNWCDGMFITHQHIDHVYGASLYLEWLLRAWKMIDIVLTPSTIEDGSIPKYYLWASPERSSHNLMLLDWEKDFQCWPYKLTSFEHYHWIPCYWFTTVIDAKKITHISDTWYSIKVQDDEWEKIIWKDKVRWFQKIIEKHEKLREVAHWSDILIINMDVLEYRKVSITHLTAYDIIDIVKDNNIKDLIIAHMNPCGNYSASWIDELREFIQSETWVRVTIPWKDWLEFEF